jgi:hypothetical protein
VLVGLNGQQGRGCLLTCQLMLGVMMHLSKRTQREHPAEGITHSPTGGGRGDCPAPAGAATCRQSTVALPTTRAVTCPARIADDPQLCSTPYTSRRRPPASGCSRTQPPAIPLTPTYTTSGSNLMQLHFLDLGGVRLALAPLIATRDTPVRSPAGVRRVRCTPGATLPSTRKV